MRPMHTSKDVRLVCTSWRDAYNAGVQRATLRLSPLVAIGPTLPQPPPCAPLLRLDAAHMALGCRHITTQCLDLNRLAKMLQVWPVAAPLELDLSSNGLDAQSMAALRDVLKSAAFAPRGLQVLDLSGNFKDRRDSIAEACAREVAAALPALPQLSALHELRLAGCGLGDAGVAALCGALQAATHVRALTLLDLTSDMREQGMAALAAGLCNAPHLRSLQQLLLAAIPGDPSKPYAAAALASSVVKAHLALTVLDLQHHDFGDHGAAAWAAALSAATCLGSLEVLDLAYNNVSAAGISQLTNALQAATHLTRMRRLSLLPCALGDAHCCPAACPARVACLLQEAPHLAASLQDVGFTCCNLEPSAMAPLCSAISVMHLTRLDFSASDLTIQSMRQLCAALAAATNLTRLRELDLGWALYDDEGPRSLELLASALVASTHLSGLRGLRMHNTLVAGLPRVVDLLHAAPHLRGLTELLVDWEQPGDLASLRPALELLPALRILRCDVCNGDAAALEQLQDALAPAPCAPYLEELLIKCSLADDWRANHCNRGAVAQLGRMMQACTRLLGLRRLTIVHNGQLVFGNELDRKALEEMSGMLGACRHLSGLQELRFGRALARGCDLAAVRQRACEELSLGGQLLGTRVIAD